MRTRIKICCISSLEEANMAIRYGADAIGLVGKMPSGPGPIADELIAEIAGRVPPPIATFLLTSEQSTRKIVEHLERTRTNTVQIVDELTEGAYHEIRFALPNIRIVQVIHVVNEEAIEQALRVQDDVDAILLDSGNPKGKIKTLGGTGNVHDWKISRELVRQVNIPVFLAGGLNAQNVAQAIAEVAPFGVDICSGVRTNGWLDEEKLSAFIGAIR
jgi:phosphoribosylanthranilate isomerase